MKKAEGKNGAKGWLITLGVIVGFVLIAGIAYAWDVIANQDKIPRSVSVGGVDISAMERTAAVAKLEDELTGVETQPVTVTADKDGKFTGSKAAKAAAGSMPITPATSVFFPAPSNPSTAMSTPPIEW